MVFAGFWLSQKILADGKLVDNFKFQFTYTPANKMTQFRITSIDNGFIFMASQRKSKFGQA